jgi:hypothetical protein
MEKTKNYVTNRGPIWMFLGSIPPLLLWGGKLGDFFFFCRCARLSEVIEMEMTEKTRVFDAWKESFTTPIHRL